eukprot:CAMPEP_0118890550 /NCGR_PEP_ID=MMETSP1166-20130328/961_1 /TAXON_ID=1104430 /ORGANISM="Chrysoreinhardia sp, Strain CCMP3193" /LENGTH=122 /DNA_ID=CAMNT_0006829165 /DNA_START=42 /DNA_END=407 /DNA_ORIENTATION=-
MLFLRGGGGVGDSDDADVGFVGPSRDRNISVSGVAEAAFFEDGGVVAGQVRTGIFAAVQANIREAVFAPLQGTDLFWVVSETPPEPVEAWIGAVLRGWGGPALLRNVFLDFWSPADARAVEA